MGPAKPRVELTKPASDTLKLVPATVKTVAALISTPPADDVNSIEPEAVPTAFTICTVSFAASATLGFSLIYVSPSVLDNCSVFSSATFAVIPPATAVKAIEALSSPEVFFISTISVAGVLLAATLK